MKFHEPEWVGKDVQCQKCRTKFTLEAEDENLVEFDSDTDYGTHRTYWYQLDCPKCHKSILFHVHIKEKEQKQSSKKPDFSRIGKKTLPQTNRAYLFEAPAEPIDVEAELIEEDIDYEAIRRRLFLD